MVSQALFSAFRVSIVSLIILQGMVFVQELGNRLDSTAYYVADSTQLSPFIHRYM